MRFLQWRNEMEDAVHYRALEAFCRQRSQMEDEGAEFWLAEANLWAIKRGEILSIGAIVEAQEKSPSKGAE
jgi:hypothetical protein